ncbi:DnaJ homolog subfamily B member 1-like protein [Drosera capensis]
MDRAQRAHAPSTKPKQHSNSIDYPNIKPPQFGSETSNRVNHNSQSDPPIFTADENRDGRGGGAATEEDDLLLKKFFMEVERDNEVVRSNFIEFISPSLESESIASPEGVRKQYRKLSLLVHPDKCKHPQAKEAFGALAKAQQLLLDSQEKDYILSQVTAAQEELLMKWKKQLKKDTASKINFEEQYVKSDEFQQQLKL